MTSQARRDPIFDPLLTLENSALVQIDSSSDTTPEVAK
jgi:hypothetical protein